MAICSECFHKQRRFDEYEGWRVMCTAYWQTIVPDPLTGSSVRKVFRTGECPFFNQKTRLDKDGFPYIVTDDDTEFEEDEDVDDDDYFYYGGL